MAGIRQHILPRFLLKGFASRTTSKGVYTWVFRKGKEPFETNILNVAVESKFYEKDLNTSADDIITNLESKFGPAVDELRVRTGSVEVGQIPSLIAHLAGRTKHLRANVYDSADFLFSQLRNHFQSPGTARRLFLNNPEWVEAEITKLLKQHPVPRTKRKLARNFVRQQLLTAFTDNDELFARHAAEFISVVRNALPQIVNGAHIDTLVKSAVPELRIKWYSRFKWFVAQTAENLVLPDTGCLFECGNGKTKSLDDKDDKVENIYLPISAQRLLIGAADEPRAISAAEFNKIAAMHSYECLVSVESTPEVRSLSSEIGTLSGFLTNAELERLAEELLKESGLAANENRLTPAAE